jgi:tetratricopeptide (TPR) repeat protein
MMAPILPLLLLLQDPFGDALAKARADDCRGALALLRPVTANAETPEVFGLRAECHAHLGELPEAESVYLAGLSRHPRAAGLLKSAASFLLRWRPRDERPGAWLALAVKQAPQDAEARYLYGQWALLQNREELAVAQFRKAIAMAPKNRAALVQNYTLMGVAEEQRNRPAAAVKAFQLAMAANRLLPRLEARAAQRYAEFLEKQGEAAEARKVAEEVLRSAPTFTLAQFMIARSLSQEGKTTEAIGKGEEALTSVGADLTLQRAIRSFLVREFFRSGQSEQAAVHQRWIDAQ